MGIHKILMVTLATLLLGGCGTIDIGGGLFQASPAEQKFSSGVKSYENGDYKTAMDELQKALELGLSNKGNQAQAHKHLAFIHCISAREKQCRDEFKKALEIDPAFSLEPAEAGHPVWGPAFRGVKAKSAK